VPGSFSSLLCSLISESSSRGLFAGRLLFFEALHPDKNTYVSPKVAAAIYRASSQRWRLKENLQQGMTDSGSRFPYRPNGGVHEKRLACEFSGWSYSLLLLEASSNPHFPTMFFLFWRGVALRPKKRRKGGGDYLAVARAAAASSWALGEGAASWAAAW
jgi:hypothetical protein